MKLTADCGRLVKRQKHHFALYGNTRSYNRSSAGGEAFRSLVTLAVYDTNKCNK